MTVYKAFFKVVIKYKFLIFIYTAMLILFAGFNMQTSQNSTNFVAEKPDVLIINNDKEQKLSKNLVEYIEKNSNIVNIEDNEEARNDALFYRDVSYIIYIPENYSKDFLNGLNPEIKIKSAGDAGSSYAEMMITRYIKVANIYEKEIQNEDELIKTINETLEKEANIEITLKLDVDNLSRATFYYNFMNYSILAGCVYVICIIISSFREEKIRKRTIISSMNYKKYNKCIMLSSILYVLFVVILYTILGYFVFGSIMFSKRGLIYILNTFIFAIVALALSLLVSTLVNKKEAVSGIVNVVALSQAFLCGAFIPVMWLPDSVLKLAHVFPAYYYINSNELLASLEVLNLSNLKLIFINMGVMILFIVIFIILNNIFSKKKQVLR